MCMMDIWIASHSVTSYLGSLGSITVKANPKRLALVIGSANSYRVTDDRGTTLFIMDRTAYFASYTTTDTNAVPPTPTTGTITASSTTYLRGADVIKMTDFGNVIQRGLVVESFIGTGQLWEIEADTVLAEYLNKLEYSQGFPFTNIVPPSVKHG